MCRRHVFLYSIIPSHFRHYRKNRDQVVQLLLAAHLWPFKDPLVENVCSRLLGIYVIKFDLTYSVLWRNTNNKTFKLLFHSFTFTSEIWPPIFIREHVHNTRLHELYNITVMFSTFRLQHSLIRRLVFNWSFKNCTMEESDVLKLNNIRQVSEERCNSGVHSVMQILLQSYSLFYFCNYFMEFR